MDNVSPREAWRRELFAVAESLRRTGRQRRLRDVTIVLPLDHAAVNAIELACLVLAQGELSASASELDRFFQDLEGDAYAAQRFLDSVRSVARRAGSDSPGPGVARV
jgi:hypothetical protein